VSPLSYDEQRELAAMLETIRCELVGYLNPEMEMGEIVNTSITRDPGSYRRLVKNVLPSSYAGARKDRKKGKTN
jgi:hypothetical protein